MKKVYYYSDELNDDFAGTNINQRPLKANYKYIKKNPIWNFIAFLFYYIIATPLVFLLQKIVYGEKLINRKVLKKHRKEGFFLYGNHTTAAGDAFTPTMLTFPKKAYILVNPDAVSIPVVSSMVEMLGGMPLPTEMKGLKNLSDAVKERVEKKNCIVIYPEAHIWPYYTKIRHFKDASFKYPAMTGKAVYCFTKTFQKPFLGIFKRTKVYVDGPFLPDPNLSVKENQKMLRDQVFNAMTKRAENSTYEYTKYIKVEKICQTNDGKTLENAASAN